VLSAFCPLLLRNNTKQSRELEWPEQGIFDSELGIWGGSAGVLWGLQVRTAKDAWE
jgi:hypothetical protein